jgi:1,4-alpha-glucan branching enzyme
MAKKAIKNKEQTFSIPAPNAMSVLLVGEFTQWQEKPIKLTKGPDGVWSVKLELAPGAHRYRFIVDGQWCEDPACGLHAPNPYGSQDSIRQVA